MLDLLALKSKVPTRSSFTFLLFRGVGDFLLSTSPGEVRSPEIGTIVGKYGMEYFQVAEACELIE